MRFTKKEVHYIIHDDETYATFMKHVATCYSKPCQKDLDIPTPPFAKHNMFVRLNPQSMNIMGDSYDA